METHFWSNCFGWDAQRDLDALIESLAQKHQGQCSVSQYQSFGRWRGSRAFQFEKSVDYLGLPYVTRIFSELFVKRRGTKVFVMLRYPPPRIASTWKFFVGAEKDNMPDEYGDVERFTRHLLQNERLLELVALLEGEVKLMDLDWTHAILPKWNEYMVSLQAQCAAEAPVAGFKAEYCDASQLLRRAVGLSCYIVPVMQWMQDLGADVAVDAFRIIQSELYFADGKDVMDRLVCWAKQGTVDADKCETDALYQAGAVKIKKLQGTLKSKTSDFSEELLARLHAMFEPCNARLHQLLEMYPQLALKQFVWQHWQFQP